LFVAAAVISYVVCYSNQTASSISMGAFQQQMEGSGGEVTGRCLHHAMPAMLMTLMALG